MLTIFTPTYNRAYCLDSLYKSLCNQSNQDFEWLIIDDGSFDNTKELIDSFVSQNKIRIRYYFQKNAGKHVAHNKGVELCESELFVCVDSDDVLKESAVQIILEKYRQVKSENILGIYFRKEDSNGKPMASKYPKGIEKVGITDLYHKYNFQGETVIVFRTDLIKKYKFPVFENEKFVTERVFYNQLNHIAPMLLCEDSIYVAEYLSDGYTKNSKKLVVSNPYGTAVDCLFEAYHHVKLLQKMKNYAQYLAIVKVFKLDKNLIKKYNRSNIFIKGFARVLLIHYIRLYKKILSI